MISGPESRSDSGLCSPFDTNGVKISCFLLANELQYHPSTWFTERYNRSGDCKTLCQNKLLQRGQKPWGKVMEQIISLYSRLIKCGRIRENCVPFALNL
jgi:hypothetical protein